MERELVVVAAVLLIASSPAQALIEVTATDPSIARYTEWTPKSEGETVLVSTTDYLEFSSGSSDTRAAWTYAVDVSFVGGSDGATSTTTLDYQGTTSTLTDLVMVAQSSSGPFAPASVSTATDLTGEGGWTKHADCGTVVYQGTVTIPRRDSAGAALADATHYYQVCDSSVEVYVGTTRDVSSGDLGYVVTHTTSSLLSTAADYEVSLGGLTYIFTSAADAGSVTFTQGRIMPSTGGTQALYTLFRFPAGFPAGEFDATVTVAASNINNLV